MNADAFRHFYEYHFAENRKIWDRYVMPLTQEQFTRPVEYSIGSVRNQIVHLMSVDDYWFSGLRDEPMPDLPDPAAFEDRKVIREHWDTIEAKMRSYLSTLQDDMLFKHPLKDGVDQALELWQVLLQVANHGTDHRAQILRVLNDLGQKTDAQDYIFYFFDHLQVPRE